MGDTCSTAEDKLEKRAARQLLQVSTDQLLFSNNPRLFTPPAGLEPIPTPTGLPPFKFTQESFSSFSSIDSCEQFDLATDASLVCNWGPGFIYFGQQRAKSRTGWGRYMSEDGSVYEGEWQTGKSHGRGRIIHPSGDVYTGDWVEDRIEGFGLYIGFDGASYEGEWKNDKQHGRGKEVWTDGSTFEGRYEDGLKDGIGIFRWADG